MDIQAARRAGEYSRRGDADAAMRCEVDKLDRLRDGWRLMAVTAASEQQWFRHVADRYDVVMGWPGSADWKFSVTASGERVEAGMTGRLALAMLTAGKRRETT
jgi:hypothetical protein